jgi:hypothetical protein
MSGLRIFRRDGQGSDLLRRFVREDAGQDLIEYAFLALFIGVAGYLVLDGIRDQAAITYSSWIDPAAGTPSLWEPVEPPP